jgi:hypothetical protein
LIVDDLTVHYGEYAVELLDRLIVNAGWVEIVGAEDCDIG